MLHIIMSFPFAFCIYRYVFGIVPVYTLSFLSIYVILAIGAPGYLSTDPNFLTLRLPSI